MITKHRGGFLALACSVAGGVGQQAVAQSTSTNDAQPAQKPTTIEEIVVTAEKNGAEDLLKTPVPVAVVSAEELTGRAQVRLQDFFSEVPGFIVAPSFAGQTNLSIRGINSGGTPTVGVLIDDVPFGSETQTYIPELDPGDLARVEVLRGPQGTIFGADSEGGLIRYVTVAPSTDAFSGQVSAGTDSVKGGDGFGFNIRGSVNIPVTDDFAIRASAFRRQEAGYIDDILTNERGSNRSDASGERVAALWRPTDHFSITLSAINQSIDNTGLEVVPSLGDLRSNIVKNGSATHINIKNYGAVISDYVGTVHIESITGYNTIRQNSNTDVSPLFGPIVAAVTGAAPDAVITGPVTNDKISEELRASSPIGKHVDLQVGLFYTHETTAATTILVGVYPLTGLYSTPTTAVFYETIPTTLEEYAAFENVTVHFTDRFDLQLGARVAHINQDFLAYYTYGPVNTPDPSFTPAGRASATPFTYLVTPRYFLTPDVMVYFRAASGYRPGGVNNGVGSPPPPPTYGPDQTHSYEIGMKGAFIDRRLTADLSLFHIDWKGVQITEGGTGNQLPYTGNGGAAKSEGVELSVTAKPFEGTTVSWWVDYDNSVLTTTINNPSTYASAGSLLPFATRLSGDVSIQQNFREIQGVTPFASVDASYTGHRLGILQPTAARQSYPGYTQTNVQMGLNHRTFTANLFINNVGDVRGQLNGGIGYAQNPLEFVIIQPRTIGVSVTNKF
jgi:iron complex outermembrane recepter protein